jgi:hypothetical protein
LKRARQKTQFERRSISNEKENQEKNYTSHKERRMFCRNPKNKSTMLNLVRGEMGIKRRDSDEKEGNVKKKSNAGK